MKKLKNFILILSVFSIIFSCDNNDNPQDEIDDNFNLTEITFIDLEPSSLFDVHYNGQGKINELISNETKIIVEYNDANLVKERRVIKLPENEISFKYIFTYSTDFSVMTEIGYEYVEGTIVPEFTTTREYTFVDNHISERKTYNSNSDLITTKYFEWTSDNLTNITTYNSSGELISEMDLSYDMEKLNVFNSTYPDFWLINEFAGFDLILYSSKNILNSNYHNYMSGVEIDNFEYTYHSSGIIEKIFLNDDEIIMFKYE